MQPLTQEAGILERVDSLIGAALREADAIYDRELTTPNPYVRDILSHTRRFRGKRLRPTLLLLTAQATGGIRAEHIKLAAAVEMIHTATLVHDDVLDDAERRRHVATVNSRWNNSTSVLFGDFLFSHAFHLAADTGDTRACRMIGAATHLVCTGELTQVRERGNLDLSVDEYLDVIGGKTGELCALACRLGASFGGGAAEKADACEDFGRLLGMAFQIADDILDLVGSEQRTGKSLGSDLAQQKLTLPLIDLLAVEPSAAGLMRELAVSDDEVLQRRLLELLHARGSIGRAQERADAIAIEAQGLLNTLSASPAKSMLQEMAKFAVRRSA